MAGNLFLSLNDAVKVAVQEFDIDPEMAQQEFEQKCRIPGDAYRNGYLDGMRHILDMVREEVVDYDMEPIKNVLWRIAKNGRDNKDKTASGQERTQL